MLTISNTSIQSPHPIDQKDIKDVAMSRHECDQFKLVMMSDIFFWTSFAQTMMLMLTADQCSPHVKYGAYSTRRKRYQRT